LDWALINLVRPTSDLYSSWADAVSEFVGEHIAVSGLADHTERMLKPARL